MEDFLAGKLRFAFEPPQKVKNSTQSDVTRFLSLQSNFTLSSWWPLWRGVTPSVLLFSALIFIDCLRCRQSNRRDYVAQFHLRLLHSTRSRIFCRNVFLLLLLCKLSDFWGEDFHERRVRKAQVEVELDGIHELGHHLLMFSERSFSGN